MRYQVRNTAWKVKKLSMNISNIAESPWTRKQSVPCQRCSANCALFKVLFTSQNEWGITMTHRWCSATQKSLNRFYIIGCGFGMHNLGDIVNFSFEQPQPQQQKISQSFGIIIRGDWWIIIDDITVDSGEFSNSVCVPKRQDQQISKRIFKNLFYLFTFLSVAYYRCVYHV